MAVTAQLSKHLARALRDYDELVNHLRTERKLPFEVAEQLARTLLIAAYIDSLDTTLATGLPTAGEGV